MHGAFLDHHRHDRRASAPALFFVRCRNRACCLLLRAGRVSACRNGADTLIAQVDAVWIWPGIPLTERRGTEVLRIAAETLRFWITRLPRQDSRIRPVAMTIPQLLERYIEIGTAQDEALFNEACSRFNRLFDKMVEIEDELKSRRTEARRVRASESASPTECCEGSTRDCASISILSTPTLRSIAVTKRSRLLLACLLL